MVPVAVRVHPVRLEWSEKERGALLVDTVNLLGASDRVDDVERGILAVACRMTEARGAALLTLSDDGKMITRVVLREVPDTVTLGWLPGKPAPGGVVKEACQLLKPAEGGGGGSEPEACMPLVDGGVLRGLVCVWGLQCPLASWSEGELRAQTSVMAMALQRARGAMGAVATERLQELQQQLAGVMGHDLRNPLAAVMISAGVLGRARDMDPRHVETLARMSSSATRMKAMLSDVVDYVNVRAGGALPMLAGDGDVMGGLRRVTTEIERTTGVKPELVGPAMLSANVDPDRLEQAAVVLLHNAVTHGAKGGKAQLLVEADRGALRIVVENQGNIADEARGQLYAPLRKGKTTGTRALGLGLFLTREIARGHGGTLTEETGDGHTRFTLSIPGVVGGA